MARSRWILDFNLHFVGNNGMNWHALGTGVQQRPATVTRLW